MKTGKAGSELRPEAIEYLGIAFAYDDWNENQVPIRRGPADRPRTHSRRVALAAATAMDARGLLSAGAGLLRRSQVPGGHRSLAAGDQEVAESPPYPRGPQRHRRRPPDAQRVRERHRRALRAHQYVQGSAWWNANMDRPAEQRNAEQLAENALIVTAIHHHQRAQRLRQQCVQERNVRLCRDSQDEYELAATAYRGYLERYPNNPQGYELHYNLADALYWSKSYEQAATEYAEVRDSNVDDSYLAESARRVVESLKRICGPRRRGGASARPRRAPRVPRARPRRSSPSRCRRRCSGSHEPGRSTSRA